MKKSLLSRMVIVTVNIGLVTLAPSLSFAQPEFSVPVPDTCKGGTKEDAYWHGRSAGYNGSSPSNPYRQIQASRCYEIGYQDGSFERSTIDTLRDILI